jgi:ribosomal-protein-alanine N-acetyltransferase
VPNINDAGETLSFYELNKEHLAPWDPKVPSNFYSLKYWEHKNQRAQEEFLMKSSLRLNIYIKKTSELIGMCNFTGIERGPFQNCHLGYKLGQSFQGHGYMQEALKVSLKFIFDEWNLHRVEANYIPHNKRSAKVLRALNFEEHGIARKYLRIAGSWQDHILTSLVNENWILKD